METEKEEEEEKERPRRVKRMVKKPAEVKADSDEDSSPPKGRDFDLNQIRSELKGFEKAVKVTTEIPEPVFEESKQPEQKLPEKKEEKQKTPEKVLTTEDIYEFKEPEPFEFGSKLNEDKAIKKRLPRLFDDTEKPDKSPKKKGGKSPPKTEQKEDETKKRLFKRTPVKKTEEGEKTPPKEDKIEDPFDKLVESPSFNIGNNAVEKKPEADTKPKVVKTLNLDEPLSLFRELPETVGEDSGDRLDLSDNDDTQNEPLFTHKEQIFSDAAFAKAESTSLDPIFRGFNSKLDTEEKKKVQKDTSDDDDPIGAAIQRAMTHTMTDEDSSNDDLFITQPTTIYQPKLKPKEEVKKDNPSEDVKEPLVITTEVPKDVKTSPKEKQISPALQETDSSLLEAISLQTAEMLKKEEVKEPTIKTGTKIADSILQKFSLIKKNEEKEVKIEKPESPPEIKKESDSETPEEPEMKPEEFSETKKRPTKKIVSKEFIDTDSDSSDSEQRLIIARSDEDSQTNVSEKIDFKETDSIISPLQVNTDDSDEMKAFKFEETKSEPAEESDNQSQTVENKEEDQDKDMSLLLCKETIPGSPAPVTEVITNEARAKPKSAKSLLLEMPFASAPGNSNGKPLLAESKSPKVIMKPEPELALPLEPNEPEEHAVVNSPPMSPESTISNLSPRG